MMNIREHASADYWTSYMRKIVELYTVVLRIYHSHT